MSFKCNYLILYFLIYCIQHCYPSLYDNRDFFYIVTKKKNKIEDKRIEDKKEEDKAKDKTEDKIIEDKKEVEKKSEDKFENSIKVNVDKEKGDKILEKKDEKKDKKEKYNIVEIITEEIPNIINYYKEFIEEKKICLTIGEYKMNYTYYINDFLENNEIFWCRCCINRRFSYVIISDLQFIILHIIKENRQKGKMKFYLELNKLKETKTFPNEKKINLIWTEDPLLKDMEYNHEIIFETPENLKEFSEKLTNKKDKLMQLFKHFDDDEIRNSPSSILRMITYYEYLSEKIKNKKNENNNKNRKNSINSINKDNQINQINDKENSDELYVKNILIIYYRKALNLYCLEDKIKDKLKEKLNELV